MTEFLKENTWVISILAIAVSLISLSFVIIDRLKSWKEVSQNKKLKKDRVILNSIIELKVENFHSIERKETELNKLTSYNPNYSQLYHLIQRIETPTLSSKKLALKIENLKKLNPDDLFEIKNVPNGRNFSVQFSQSVNDVIIASKKHLANII